MQKIENCSLRSAYFQYITDTMWKPGRRNEDSPNSFIFVTEGALYFEAMGTRYAVNPGECLFLPHGVPSVGYRTSAVPTGRFIVSFHTAGTASAPAHFALADPHPVRELLTQLVKAAYHADFPREGLDAMLHAVFYILYYQQNTSAEASKNSLADSIREYVHNSITRNTTVSSVAAHFNLTSDYVNRTFSRAEHISLKTYINRLQIKRIEEYLISPNVQVQTVAQKMSFPSLQALSKFYKYHTGRTLEEYRTQFAREVERK